MRKFKSYFHLLWISLTLLLLSSCRVNQYDKGPTMTIPKTSETPVSRTATLAATTQPIVTPEHTPSPSSTPIPTILTSTQTPRPTSYWATWTPDPGFDLRSAQTKVRELLETNAGCKLPCWWGITPGKTNITDTIRILYPLAGANGIYFQGDKSVKYLDFIIPIPEDNSSVYELHGYTFDNDLVSLIEVTPGNVGAYRLNLILSNYGVPEEVWVRGLLNGINNPMSVYLYYKNQGIVAAYDEKGIEKGQNVQICLGKKVATSLILWKPEETLSFREFALGTRFLDSNVKEDQPMTLTEATGLDVVSFYKLFSGGSKSCMDSPKELWPIP